MTSINYLVKEFSEILGALTTQPMQDLLLVDAINKAKEKHRIEILRARQNGLDNGFSNGNWDSDLYYQETFVSNGSID